MAFFDVFGILTCVRYNKHPPMCEMTPGELADMWQRDFPEWNADNLHTKGVIDVTGEKYKFVVNTHPMIALLRTNEEMLHQKVDSHLQADGQFYKVSHQVIGMCCITLRREVFGVDSDGLF
jgi:hypothetical protein